MITYKIQLVRKKRWTLSDPWVWKMAWRDARHNFRRLFLFAASLIAGIAAVVAIGSLNYSVQEDLNRNARELLGADFAINSNKRPEASVQAAMDSLGMEQARTTEMASMVLFTRSGQSRLIQLMALTGNYPFYGAVESEPAVAYSQLSKGGTALIDETLALQYEVSTGDSVKVGNKRFYVAGTVKKFPGRSGILTTFTPSVYIALTDLESTGLVQFGSRISYHTFFKAPDEPAIKTAAEKLKPLLKPYGYGIETVESRKEGLGRGFQSVYRFFSLLAFVALMLGCIGVASSVHIYAREKREEVAILRCIGSSGWQSFSIYFVQVLMVGLLASVAGALAGAAIQQLIPVVFGDFIPVTLSFVVSWPAIWQGLLLGTAVSLLFSALPLLSIRSVPPLTVLRAESVARASFSKARWLLWVLIGFFPIAAAAFQTGSWLSGILFAAGLAVALGCLSGVAWLLLRLVRRYFPSRAPFAIRHALANLYRPQNQTRMLMISIGLGVFILATLNIVQYSLLGQVEFTGNTNQVNTILFDIQDHQLAGIRQLFDQQKQPIHQTTPIITCRIAEIKGKRIEALVGDTSRRMPNWALTREYRVTYRDTLTRSEELTSGALQSIRHGQRDSVWVTISEGMQETLGVQLNDSMVFDIQGVPVAVRIGGIRKVDWPVDPPNFVFVFPSGVLEPAPKIWVTTTRMESDEKASSFQQALVTLFPNVSYIDLRLVLSTVTQLFDKISLVVRFLALFSIVTGLVVLAGAVANSRYIRIKENVLLRTIGAGTALITKVTLLEYAFLGVFSALTGVLLSTSAGYFLCRFFLEVDFAVDSMGLAFIGLGTAVLCLLIGWLNSRGIIRTPPLQVLRKEV
ncbi:MAG: FtsX-like permease family protein [Cyclobacteriaceae bacterium]